MSAAQPPAAEPVYTLRQVSRQREKGGVRFELEIPSLTIGRGEFVAVIGPSGCGKSTLLDLLGLALGPSHAQTFCLSVTGDPAGRWDIARLAEEEKALLRQHYLGYVLQSGGLLPFLTVRENIELPGRLAGTPACRERCSSLARSLGIFGQLSKKPQDLSGGQRQRAAIARSLIHNPAILLADEPTAAVDRPNAVEIRDQFTALVRQNSVAVLMVTHDRELVLPVIDRLLGFELERVDETHTRSRLKELSLDGDD